MWQLSELNRLLEEQENEAFGDSRTLCLANPAEKEEIDERIIEEIWPGAVAALRESAITTWIVPGQTLNETIKDAHGQYTTRTLTFLLEDPDRPIGPECMKPWFCRIVIRCSALDYMVSSDFTASFPATFSTAKLFRLIKEPLMQGNPPSLSFSDSSWKEQTFDIEFTGGAGAGWGLHSPETAKDKLFTTTQNNLAIINAMYDLEKDYTSTARFNALCKAILNAYEAY